jgi:predicted negative regulator of RcsB-dependent stress response
LDKALEFFRRNIENYPHTPYIYHSYGEALLKKGDKKNAMTNFENAFELDPQDIKAKNIVHKLESESQ